VARRHKENIKNVRSGTPKLAGGSSYFFEPNWRADSDFATLRHRAARNQKTSPLRAVLKTPSAPEQKFFAELFYKKATACL
jgi:hypothetical protein